MGGGGSRAERCQWPRGRRSPWRAFLAAILGDRGHEGLEDADTPCPAAESANIGPEGVSGPEDAGQRGFP
eukprot:8810502-Pyramimonas_sp.AAC.1